MIERPDSSCVTNSGYAMQVFLSHTSSDKDVVEPIGAFLAKRGLTVWLDAWSMTPGDSLINKIAEGLESSDRIVVFLSPDSVESNWVRKEVATGLVMELAEEKGLGDKFIVPALLVPCKIPIMLRDKLYANFTNKAFDAACEELLLGIASTPKGATDRRIENRIVRVHTVAPVAPGQHALVVEFAVRISPTEGLHIGVDVTVPYDTVHEWFAPPNQPMLPPNPGGVFTDSAIRREPPIYARKFSSPGVTSSRSYYLRFEGNAPFTVKEYQFLDSFDREP